MTARAVVRRTPAELRLARFLSVGQLYRRREDRTVWWLRSIYRADAAVLLISAAGDRLVQTFEQLREGWLWIATPSHTVPREEAPAVTDPRVALAEQLRAVHLAAHDVVHALDWDQLQPAEQERWLLAADTATGETSL